MTENEAISLIKNLKFLSSEDTYKKHIDAIKLVIQALEEIQQYRAIGTVEGYERAIQISIENYNLYKEYKAKVQEFESIGTIEDFKDLKEKEIPKKPIYSKKYGYHCYDCPVCGTSVTIEMEHGCEPDYRLKRCEECGQVINWCETN